MLMQPDKKKMASLIIASAGPKKDEIQEAPTKDGAEQDNSIAEQSAAEDVMAAIESKDPKALVSAFKALMEICDSQEDSAEQEME
jgi:hypothetical protein